MVSDGCNAEYEEVDEDSSDEEEEHAIARPKTLHTLPFLYCIGQRQTLPRTN